MPRKIYPLPELITDEQYKIQERDKPSVDLASKIINCSLEDDPYSVFHRAHEQAHIKWTPANAENQHVGVSGAAIQAVEDMRMHALLNAAGVNTSNGGITEAFADQIMLNIRDLHDAACCAIASYGTGDAAKLKRMVEVFPEIPEIVEQIHSKLKSTDFHDFKTTVEAAKWLTELTSGGAAGKGNGASKNPPMPGDKKSIPNINAAEDNKNPSKGMYAPTRQSAYDNEPDMKKDLDKLFPGGTLSHVTRLVKPKPGIETTWGTMAIEEPPLELSTACIRTKFRSQDTGAILRNAHRMPIDSRVFSVKKRTFQISILMDVSGSMGFKEEHMLRLLLKAPAAVIAVYAGFKDKGILRVLSSGGKKVNSSYIGDPTRGGGCNVIDGPALEWLSKQPAPRFWLSDGLVTGVGDLSTTPNVVDAKAITTKGKIKRIGNLDALLTEVNRIAGRRYTKV